MEYLVVLNCFGMDMASSSSQLPANINSICTPAVENKDEIEPSWYLPLYIAARKGDWESAERFFKLNPDAIIAKIAASSKTALHIAVGSGKKSLHFVENLVELMPPEALAQTDSGNQTALTIAAIVGNIEAAKLLLTKNADLPYILDCDGVAPLHRAAQYCHKVMLRYLLEFTRDDIEPCPLADESGALLLRHVIHAGFYDMALNLVQRDPKLAITVRRGNPLIILAGKPSAFPSGSRLNFWHRMIHSLCQKLQGNLWQVVQALVPHLKHIRDMKLMQHHVLQLVKILCTEISSLESSSKAGSIFHTPTLLAAKHGIQEIVEEIIDSFPYAILYSDEFGRDVITQAIMFRQENVFNLLYKMDEHKQYISQSRDTIGNNILHLAGNLAPPHRLNLVSGAALQMQRELQWFKEVEKFVQPAYRDIKNYRGKTPQMVFSEEHKHLVIEGEKWMKDTANSCTVAAALIATVVFAAAITVPGGNNGDSGLPIFSREKAFIVFAVSDALSLFSSTTSLLMFLSILTSRYAEADFLYALPKRLIIGFVTLFLSIATMMGAFSATLYIVFGHKNPWILSLIAAAACLPITLFAFLISPLLVEMISSTYGPGIFGKQSDHPFY